MLEVHHFGQSPGLAVPGRVFLEGTLLAANVSPTLGAVRWVGTLVDDVSAALVIRVWSESGAEQFRARLTTTDTSLDAPAGGERTVALVASRGELMDAVGTWLDEFVRRASEAIDRQ